MLPRRRHHPCFWIAWWLALAAFPVGMAAPAASAGRASNSPVGSRAPAEELLENLTEQLAECSQRVLRLCRRPMKAIRGAEFSARPGRDFLAAVQPRHSAATRTEMARHNGFGAWLRT